MIGNYLLRVGDALSQLLNVALFNGQANESLSGRSYRLRRIPSWGYLYSFINSVFFWQEDHCKASYDADVTRAGQTLRGHPRG